MCVCVKRFGRNAYCRYRYRLYVCLYVCMYGYLQLCMCEPEEDGWRALAILPSVTFAQGEAGQQIRPEWLGAWGLHGKNRV